MQHSEQSSKKRVLPHTDIILLSIIYHTAVQLCGLLFETIQVHVYSQIILVDNVVNILRIFNKWQSEKTSALRFASSLLRRPNQTQPSKDSTSASS